MSLSIEVDGLEELTAALDRFSQFRNDFRRKLPRIVLAEMKKRVRARLKSEKKGPDGESWDPWTDETRAARQRKGSAGRGLLTDEQKLVNSFRVVSVPGGFDLGTSLPYARAQHFGHPHWERKSARPFMGLGRKDVKDLDRIITDWVGRQWP